MKDDGGPAFPVVTQWQITGEHDDTRRATDLRHGMTLRDYFAAHAPEPYESWHDGERSMKNIIEWRWSYADAMLAERKKGAP